MASMDQQLFKTEIASPERKTLYIISGDDPSGIDGCLEAARNVVNPNLYQLNYRSFGLEVLAKNSVMGFIQSLVSPPLAKPPRIVILSLSEKENLLAAHLETLGKVKAQIAKLVTLIIVFRGSFDARLKFFKEVAKTGAMVECKAPSRYNLHNWLIARFKEKGLRIGLEAAKLMIERAGVNLGALLSEIEKLSVYPGPDLIITTDHIRELVSLGNSAIIYELASPLALGRLDKAIPIKKDLATSMTPVRLTNALASHFSDLLRIRLYLDTSLGYVTDENLAADLSIHKYRVKLLREQLEYWNQSSISQALSAAQNTVRSILTGNAPGEVAVDTLMVTLARLAKGSD